MMRKTSLNEAVEALAPSILQLVELHQRAAPDMRAYLKKNILLLCRHLESFAPVHMSLAAYRRAVELRLPQPDLRQLNWASRHKIAAEGGEKLFHWEHMMTVSEFGRRLFDQDVSLADVERVLLRAEVAWVLNEENEALREKGFNSNRPSPAAAYEDAGIVLIKATDPLPSLA